MKFAIITQVMHKTKGDKWYSYAPYVREMDLWLTKVNTTKIVAPSCNEEPSKVEIPYKTQNIELIKVPSFDIIRLVSFLKTIANLPFILITIYKTMKWADHIHLRCPGNMGLLGCLVQVLFPSKPKTVKYAGNWDPDSKNQPISYRFQKWLLSNTILTKNCKVLVYGEWENQSKNILPFFTASYYENEIIPIKVKDFSEYINFIYVGTFSKGKQPLLTAKVVENLVKKGYPARLTMFGDGKEFLSVKEYIESRNLTEVIFLKGNQSKEIVKSAYQTSHFLIFISKSEGWPKVVSESMFWSCLPLSTKVSCIPYMLDDGNRGAIVNDDIKEISQTIEKYLNNFELYNSQVSKAKEWSQKYTLDKFEKEIVKLI